MTPPAPLAPVRVLQGVLLPRVERIRVVWCVTCRAARHPMDPDCAWCHPDPATAGGCVECRHLIHLGPCRAPVDEPDVRRIPAGYALTFARCPCGEP